MLRDAVELPESEEEFNQIYFENLLPRVFPSVSGSLNVWFQIISVKGLEGTQIGTETFPSESTKQTHLNQIKKYNLSLSREWSLTMYYSERKNKLFNNFRQYNQANHQSTEVKDYRFERNFFRTVTWQYANESNLIFD